MDFLKIIRSLEELLYEAMTWLVFYPRTMWRIATRPLETTSYSEREQTDAAAQQYTDTLSPPLLLMLTLLIAHGLGLGLGARTPETDSAIGKTIFGSAQNLLMLRALAFSIFPLTAATTLLRRRHLAIDRKTLRGPFFSQCYLTAPFALAVSIGTVLMRTQAGAARPAGAAVALLGLAWYLAVETRWFQRQLELPAGRALLVGLWTFARAAFYWFVLGAVLVALLAQTGERSRERARGSTWRRSAASSNSIFATALLFTVLPLSFAFRGSEVTFLLIRDAPIIGLAWQATAAVMWGWHIAIRRRLRVSGL